MVNRTAVPELKPIDHINFVEPKQFHIATDVTLFHMDDVMNESTRIDLYFDAGKIHGAKGIPSFVNGLLLSGTKEKTSIEIHESINGMGAFYESGVSMESATVSIYCLREKAIDILREVIQAIGGLNFHEKEVYEYLADQKQGHRIAMKKVSYLAQREFQTQMFHSDQRYARVISEKDFENVDREELIAFHDKYYLNGLRRVSVVGNMNQQDIETIVKLVKPFASSQKQDEAITLVNEKGLFHKQKEDALQTAIRVGRILFNKTHPDYLDFLILNTILGDYFGSRLMSNIREDKGYTYGVGSAIAEFDKTGYFLIATEVGKDFREATLQEIRSELKQLQDELVPDEELELVKNYMLGQLLKSADGPYAMMDLFLSAELNGLDLEFYNSAIRSIEEITAERLSELAVKYLSWDDLTIVSAG